MCKSQLHHDVAQLGSHLLGTLFSDKKPRPEQRGPGTQNLAPVTPVARPPSRDGHQTTQASTGEGEPQGAELGGGSCQETAGPCEGAGDQASLPGAQTVLPQAEGGLPGLRVEGGDVSGHAVLVPSWGTKLPGSHPLVWISSLRPLCPPSTCLSMLSPRLPPGVSHVQGRLW